MSEQNIEELFQLLQQLDTTQLVVELRRLKKEDPATFKQLRSYMREQGWSTRKRDDREEV